jgi:hypothetical protein
MTMLIEECPVSRKTPNDGMLEISSAAAAKLAALGPEFPVRSEGRDGTARLHAMACTCAKGAGASHIHHFIESPMLRALIPGTDVRVEMDDQPAERPRLRIEPA